MDPNTAKLINQVAVLQGQVNEVAALAASAASTANLTTHTVGAGSPEGAVTANPGSTYFNSTSNALFVKETGTGNTGWI